LYETFQNAGDVKKVPLAYDEKQPESQEVRPVASGKRIAKNDGCPDARGQDADRNHKRVLAGFAGRRCKRQFKRAKTPHSKSSDREVLDGPAMRPKIPLAVENSVVESRRSESQSASPVARLQVTLLPQLDFELRGAHRKGARSSHGTF